MKVLVSGASGLVGSALKNHLVSQGHEVVPLIRAKQSPGDGIPWWDPSTGRVELGSQGAFDAVVHLAGENIASGRWTSERMQRIRSSRVDGTHALCTALAGCKKLPNCLIAASAIGYYGNRGSDSLSESSGPGSGFLSDVVQEWEATTEVAADVGIRVVNLRIGVVLSTKGGALAKMLTPFKLGIGGVVGRGRQIMSWIDIEDLTRVVEFCLSNEQMEGAVNAVAPNPVSNREFTKALGCALHRPTTFPLPAFVVRILFGQMGDELLLRGSKVLPDALGKTQFSFKYPTLKSSLSHLLKAKS